MLVAAIGKAQRVFGWQGMEPGQARINRMGLVACIADGVLVIARHDLGFDKQRMLEHGLGGIALVGGVVGIHEQKRAGLNFAIHAAGRLVDHGAGARAGDQRDLNARTVEFMARAVDLFEHLLDGGFAFSSSAQMLGTAVVGLQARKAQAGVALNGVCQRKGWRTGLHAAAVLAHIDFHQYIDCSRASLCVLHGLGKASNAFFTVHGNGQTPALRI